MVIWMSLDRYTYLVGLIRSDLVNSGEMVSKVGIKLPWFNYGYVQCFPNPFSHHEITWKKITRDFCIHLRGISTLEACAFQGVFPRSRGGKGIWC